MKEYFKWLGIILIGLVLLIWLLSSLPPFEYVEPGLMYDVEEKSSYSDPIIRIKAIRIKTITGTFGDREINLKRRQVDEVVTYTGTIGKDEVNIRIVEEVLP